jgi:outer membrane protein assembly factor BamB
MRGGAGAAARAVAGIAAGALVGVLVLGTQAVLAPGAVAGPAGSSSAQRAAAAPAAIPVSDWPAYLNGPLHASYNASQTVITPATVPMLDEQWLFKTGAPYTASPTVADNAVFIGSARGWFYKLNDATGKVLDKIYIGRQPALTCAAAGITSTATVAPDPATGVLSVYVDGGDGYLYALKASNLNKEWRSVIGIPSAKVNNYYDWSSPTVANGRIYVGVSSNCDKPLIRGGVIDYNQASGRQLAEFYSVPARAKNAGGSVWSSIGVSRSGYVYATTGNGPRDRPRLRNSESILKLSPVKLRLLASFKVPASQVTKDGDFGASPAFFDGLVGACNKNGVFYAVRQSTMKLAWRVRIANAAGSYGECLAAPAYDGTDLFIGGQTTTIGGTTFPGSVQELQPSTGTVIWSTGLTGGILGSPALDGGGVLAIGTYTSTGTGVYLVDAATGAVTRQIMTGATFAQPAFAGNWLFTANTQGVSGWALPAG